MSDEIRICPHCGNHVQATKVKSYSNKVTRQGVKSAVHGLTGVGAAGLGAEIGTAILPGIGTAIGFAAGFIGSAMFNQKVNETIDKVADGMTDFDLEFNCPKCGYSWKGTEIEVNSTNDDPDGYDDTVYRILNCVAKQLGIDISNVSPESDLEDNLGADELDKVEIVMTIEREFNCKLKEPEEYTYVDDFIEEIAGESLYESMDDYLEDLDNYSKAVDAISECYDKEGVDIKEKFDEMVYYCVEPETNIFQGKLGSLVTVMRMIEFMSLADNGFSGYSDKKSQKMLQKELLIDGLTDMNVIVKQHPNNDEYKYIQWAEKMLNAFWVENIYDESYYDNLCTQVKNNLSYVNFKDYVFNEEYFSEELPTLILEHINNLFQKINGGEESSNAVNLNENEQSYINEVQACQEDGEIGPRERRLLDKLASKLGISPERAAELEASLSAPVLTDDEKEYLEEVQAVLADGEISEKERRLLDKLRKMLDISEERAKEIEQLAAN